MCRFIYILITVDLFLTPRTIIFGKNVFIACSTTNTSLLTLTRRWSKQNDNLTLCVDGHCDKSKKYKELETDNSTFTLEIRNFNESDVNTVYVCSFGSSNPLSNSVNVFLNEKHFECKYSCFNEKQRRFILTTNAIVNGKKKVSKNNIPTKGQKKHPKVLNWSSTQR